MAKRLQSESMKHLIEVCNRRRTQNLDLSMANMPLTNK